MNIMDLLEKYGVKLKLTEGRKKFISLKIMPPIEELLENFEQYGLELVALGETLSSGNCRDYALEKSGLDKDYGGFLSRDQIIQEEFERLKPSKKLHEGTLVGYFTDRKNLWHNHWGIAKSYKETLMVESRWGDNGNVFIHPLEIVPKSYGNYANFYDVV